MVTNKIETYLGFCIKSGKLVRGSGAVEKLKKAELIIADYAASDNSKKLAEKFCKRFCCPLVYFKTGFENAVNRAGCKIAAVCDSSLATAVLGNLNENYIIINHREVR